MLAISNNYDMINLSTSGADFLCQYNPLVCAVEHNRSSGRRRKRVFLLEGRMKKDKIKKGYCQCGCGQKTNIYKVNDKRKPAIKGEPARFISRHQFRTLKGKAHFRWKGDNAGYVAKHDWIYRYFGKANMCEHCNSKKGKRFEWANISGEYKRNRSDWKMLCSICHKEFDKDKTPRGEKQGSSKLKNKQVILIREKYSSGKYTLHSLARKFCMSLSAIQSITSGKGWRHLL